MQTYPLIAGLLGLGITLLLIPRILKLEGRTKVFRRAKDLHHTNGAPIPRLGGVALAAAFLAIEIFAVIVDPGRWARNPESVIVLISSMAMFALGFWDDLRPLGAQRKLVGQIVIALSVYWLGIGIPVLKIPFTETAIELGAWGGVITVLWLVGMTNLINLIDGVDGLAGGVCLMLMVLLACMGYQTGNFVLLGAGMAGALMGFLWFNFPPARIYLGDGGAYFLGFQVGLIALVNSHKGEILAALAAPLFVLALPIADMVLAVLRRALRGLPVFRPDKKHIHHQLLNMGFSRRKVVLSIYAVTLVFLALGLVAFWSRSDLVPALSGITTLVILLICAGKLGFSRPWFAVGKVVKHSLKMRQEVRYALCLTRLLALEGRRRESLEELWSDLVFTAQKLGFSSVKLTLQDYERVWEHPNRCEPTRSARFELQSPLAAVLELKAPASPKVERYGSDSGQGTLLIGSSSGLTLADGKLFAIFSELVAEGWVTATTQWRDRGAFKVSTAEPADIRRVPRALKPEVVQLS